MSCSSRTVTFTASARGIWPAGRVALPVVRVLPDGTHLSVLINPKIRGARRRETIMVAAREVACGRDSGGDPADLDPAEGHLVRVVEYDVPDRAGNHTGELIMVLSTIFDPTQARADELAAAYHQRWEEETSSRPLYAARGNSCGHGYQSWSTRRSGHGCWSITRSARWPPAPHRPLTSIPTRSPSLGFCALPAVPSPGTAGMPP